MLEAVVKLLESPDPSNHALGFVFLEQGYWPSKPSPHLLNLVSLRPEDLLRCLNNGWQEVGQHVRHLRLEPENPHQALLDYLPSLSNLEHLDLQDLVLQAPPNLNSLKRLKHLKMQACDWGADFVLDLSSLVDLELLHLNRVRVRFPQTEVFLPKLRFLACTDAQLEEIHPSVFRLEGLESLILYNNALEHLPFQVGELRQLQTLDLSHNFLRQLPPCLGQLRELRYLNLARNPLPHKEKQRVEQWLPERTIICYP